MLQLEFSWVAPLPPLLGTLGPVPLVVGVILYWLLFATSFHALHLCGAGAINAGFFLYYILQMADAAIARRRLLVSAAGGCVQAAAGIICMAAAVLYVLQHGACQEHMGRDTRSR